VIALLRENRFEALLNSLLVDFVEVAGCAVLKLQSWAAAGFKDTELGV
jgi:hypothetical protein